MIVLIVNITKKRSYSLTQLFSAIVDDTESYKCSAVYIINGFEKTTTSTTAMLYIRGKFDGQLLNFDIAV